MQKILITFLAVGLVGCSLSELEEVVKPPEVSTPDSSLEASQTQTLRVGNQSFYIEVADTQAEREQGLMYRESLAANQGMLFVWEQEAPRNFWMKNTLIPLDMIWLDANKTIVDIQAAEPCQVQNCPIYSGKVPAQYVLELNQGVLRAGVGQTVEF